ncbi:nucleotidyl transferase family protein [Spiroplasma taiwanense]|uniref:FAD synthase n=1 Tax=Spiroplasma taiwanense CT-1 TaxID=1276220 RepID=S5LWM4_9MOLU|nr:bifunctional riboflavin kinase/FMN adenylyltransferase [Spiroplasma taiwanense]AGR41036.1 bifunctional riboflavin kinase/FMN adenylyltransferase [Spiroplasma taiwanense CT-1]
MVKINSDLSDHQNFNFDNTKTIICIGFFDGFHKIHQKIIQKTKTLAIQENKKSIVITFSQKVNDFLKKINNNIQSQKIKYKLIEDNVNPDYLLEIQVNNHTLMISPNDFCNFLLNKLNASKIIVGSDFKFGYMGKGNADFLKQYFGSENIIIFKRNKDISSTQLKNLFEQGEIKKLNKLLNYNFLLEIKRESDNIYLIDKISIKLANGKYKINILNQSYIVNIINNSIFFNEITNFNKEIIEILEKIE